MGSLRTWFAFVVCVLLGSAPVGAQVRAHSTHSADSAEIVSTVQRLLDAIGRADSAMARSVLMPGMRLVSIVDDTVLARPRVQTDSAFIQMLGSPRSTMLERMWSPVVMSNGRIATLWAPYDFHVDGKWSHCGIDVATLLRTDAGWKVANLSYTVQRQDCPASPLGPPQ